MQRGMTRGSKTQATGCSSAASWQGQGSGPGRGRYWLRTRRLACLAGDRVPAFGREQSSQCQARLQPAQECPAATEETRQTRRTAMAKKGRWSRRRQSHRPRRLGIAVLPRTTEAEARHCHAHHPRRRPRQRDRHWQRDQRRQGHLLPTKAANPVPFPRFLVQFPQRRQADCCRFRPARTHHGLGWLRLHFHFRVYR
ncbi:hypothetical protein BC828DRAFT_388351 [Blastocladiella britannica]|nr:hypothetical protein BC828DRAFT_388351 [Blastocladiella britannica]